MPRVPLSDLRGSFRRRGDVFDMLFFECPLCTNGHGIMVSFQPPSLFENGCVWSKTGDTLEEVSLSPSINCDVPWTDKDGKQHPSSCKFHGWVRSGHVEW